MEIFIALIACAFILRYCWKEEQKAKAEKTIFMAKLEVLARKEIKEKADLLARVEALEKLVKP